MAYVLSPLISLLDYAYTFLYMLSGNYGLSIVLLSLCVAIILWPLQAMVQSRKERLAARKKKFARELGEIKECYQSQERFLYTQACYRIHGYHPLNDLIPALGLLVQIPFLSLPITSSLE